MINPDNEELLNLINIFISKAKNSQKTEEMAIELKKVNSNNPEDRAKLLLKMSQLLYNSSKFSKEEYYYYQWFSIEFLIFESRMMNNCYDSELKPIIEQMEMVEKKHGLDTEEYLTEIEYPPEYENLNNQYEKILNTNIELLVLTPIKQE